MIIAVCLIFWHNWHHRLHAIKVKGGLQSQNFKILDGLTVNLWY